MMVDVAETNGPTGNECDNNGKHHGKLLAVTKVGMGKEGFDIKKGLLLGILLVLLYLVVRAVHLYVCGTVGDFNVTVCAEELQEDPLIAGQSVTARKVPHTFVRPLRDIHFPVVSLHFVVIGADIRHGVGPEGQPFTFRDSVEADGARNMITAVVSSGVDCR